MGVQRHVPAALQPPSHLEKAGNYCIRGWVDPSGGLEGVENLAPTGIRSSERRARSESLYRLILHVLL